MHTIASLKAEYKTLVAAKAVHQVKATSWQALVNKLNAIPDAKPLSVAEIKTFVYQKFSVASTAELRKSKSFAMAIDGLDPLNFAFKSTWENLYRQFIDILPQKHLFVCTMSEKYMLN